MVLNEELIKFDNELFNLEIKGPKPHENSFSLNGFPGGINKSQ